MRLGARARSGVIFVLVVATVAGGTWLRARADVTERRPHPTSGAEEPFGDGAAIPVVADSIRRDTLVLQIVATGQAEANRRSTLAAAIGGRVVALAVREGETVDPGQLLVQIDPREAALALERAKAELAEARARYRELSLFDDEITDPDLRRERSAAIRARSGLGQAEVGLREAELKLEQTAIRAPFAGHAAKVRVAVGDHVAPGEDLLDLVDLDPIQVEIQVVESDIPSLRGDASAMVHLVAFPDTVFRGRIISISPVVDPEGRTGRVTVVVSNPGGAILPGMFARVAVEGRAFPDRLLAPKEAVVERDGRSLVFRFLPLTGASHGEGLAKWVYVTTARGDGRSVEIVDSEGDLEAGALVLTGGHITLVHDARVRIVDAGMGHDP